MGNATSTNGMRVSGAVDHEGAYNGQINGDYCRNQEQRVEGRPVYLKIDNTGTSLWFFAGKWRVGAAEDTGSRRCYASIKSEANSPDAASGVWQVVLPIAEGAQEDYFPQKRVRVVAVHVEKAKREYARSLSMANPDAARAIRHKTDPSAIHSLEDWLHLTSANNTLLLPPFSHFSRPISTYLYLRLLDVHRLERLQTCGAINGLPSSEWIHYDHTTQMITMNKHAPGALPSGSGWFSKDVVRHCRACGMGTSKPDREQCKACGGREWVASGGLDAELLKMRLADKLPKEPALYSALLPVNVLGDGNCLLHATSVGLWGVHDRGGSHSLGTLRSALNQVMLSKKALFFEKWKRQEMIWDRIDGQAMGLEGGLERSPAEWAAEFADLVARCGRDCAFLSQIHIYVLANVLRRPIIVYADTTQQDSPCRMRGLYLPLEDQVTGPKTERVPLLLAYDGAHFVPLVCHVDHWPPHKPTAPGGWPLIPLTCVSHKQGAPSIEPLPLLFAGEATGLSACYNADPVAALSQYLAVELVSRCAPAVEPSASAEEVVEEGDWWGCRGVKVGVRMKMDSSDRSSDAKVDDLWRYIAEMVMTWVQEVRGEALEARKREQHNRKLEDQHRRRSAAVELEQRRRERDLAVLRQKAVECDMAFDVKIGGECMRLGYSAGEDPLVVARDFVWAHNLWHGYVEQLAHTIRRESAALNLSKGIPPAAVGSYYSSAQATQAARSGAHAAHLPDAAPHLSRGANNGLTSSGEEGDKCAVHDSQVQFSEVQGSELQFSAEVQASELQFCEVPFRQTASDYSEGEGAVHVSDDYKRHGALQVELSGAREILPPETAASQVYVREDSELGKAIQEMGDQEWDHAVRSISGLSEELGAPPQLSPSAQDGGAQGGASAEGTEVPRQVADLQA